MLHQFAYISEEEFSFTQNSLNDLLKLARKKNKQLDLTGLLLYDNGLFFQILEGPKRSIQSIENDIRSDNRHKSMDVIYRNENLFEREFGNWRMGFKILGNNHHKDYSELDERAKDLLSKSKPNGKIAHDLLHNYAKIKSSHVSF